MTPTAIDLEAHAVEQECPQCGSASLRRDEVSSAIWNGERLVVVDAIPALLCGACGERFYADETVMQLDLLQGEGYPEDRATRFLTVPVIPFAASSARSGG